MEKTPAMSSNRPYLLRALYEWINDNNLTPYILADATYPDVLVPKSSVKDGKVVLNIAMRAVAALELGNEGLSFSARFSGASQSIYIPVEAIIAIYAQETGQGMMLPPDDPQSEQSAHTESLEQHELESGQEQADDGPPKPPIPPKSGHLRIVK
jgi:stringent starvation protein B